MKPITRQSSLKLAGAILAALGVAAAQAAAPTEPRHYHIGAYHGPTPLTLHGATVVTTAAAHQLWLDHAAFIDVWPQPPKPSGLPKGTLWITRPRLDIPGSIWLPDTGYGQLSGRMEFYFEDGLLKASHHDRTAKLVVYWTPRRTGRFWREHAGSLMADARALSYLVISC